MSEFLTCRFTHYWSNLIQRMQHAEYCGQRFPVEKKSSVPVFCMEVVNVRIIIMKTHFLGFELVVRVQCQCVPGGAEL